MAITHGRIRACAIPETTVHPKEKYQGGEGVRLCFPLVPYRTVVMQNFS
jgi:hypothetical protein